MLVMSVLKEHPWLPWKFSTTKKGWWNSRANQLTFMEWYKRHKLYPDGTNAPKHIGKYDYVEVFYETEVIDVVQHGGRSILKKHNDSFVTAVKTLYNKHHWIPWKFNVSPRGFWNEQKNRKAYMHWLMTEEGWKTMEDVLKGLSVALLHARHGTFCLSVSSV